MARRLLNLHLKQLLQHKRNGKQGQVGGMLKIASEAWKSNMNEELISRFSMNEVGIDGL